MHYAGLRAKGCKRKEIYKNVKKWRKKRTRSRKRVSGTLYSRP